MWLSTGPGGLLLPFDPPELTIAAAIGRGWAIPDGGALLLPLPPAFLPTRAWAARPFARLPKLPDLRKH